MVHAIVHIVEVGEVHTAKHREFIYVGDPIPQLSEREHAAFLVSMQKAVLYSLEKRELLTSSQRERCFEKLETQMSERQRKERQV